MVVIARKQRQAIKSARMLIDFSNIGIETEQIDRNKMEIPDASVGEEEVIQFDDHQTGANVPTR
jgi:hypothetical protein